MWGQADNSLRILVVDDNVDTALSFAFLLRSCGHEVRVAHDGRSAVEAACAFHPHAILLDIGLPRLDGFAVARQLRALPEFDRTLLVASSGFGREKDRRRASEVGIDLYLVKPFDPWRIEPVLASGRSSAAAVPA
jgi:CheY-like chemotaxis protein